MIAAMAAAMAVSAMPKVIIDTDIGSSTDDLFALEIASRYHKEDVIELAAVMLDRPGADNYAFTEAYLHYHDLDSVPIGAIGNQADSRRVFVPYATLVHTNDASGRAVMPRPPAGKRTGAVVDAVELYRRVLAASPDRSVDICAIGFFSNLMRLLDTSPDAASPLSGRDLVARKVRTLRIMAGSFDRSLDHPEYNVWGDIPSARRIFSEWPAPIVCTPYEVGVRVYYPCKEVREDFPANHPIALSYSRWDPDGPRSKSQLMWDPMTVLALIDEEKKFDFFTNSETGTIDVDSQGYTVFRPNAEGRATVQDLPLGKAVRVRRWMRRFASGENRMPEIEGGCLRVAEIAPQPREGAAGEFIVLTNLSSQIELDLSGYRVVCSRPELEVAVDAKIPQGVKLAPRGAIRLDRNTYWPDSELPAKSLNILIYGPDGGVKSEAFVDTRWWNDECDGTGRHFVAKAWRPLVLRVDQWRPSDKPVVKKPRVMILHTNDTHTHIDDGSVRFSQIATEKARLRAAGENVILADAGDYAQGTAYGGYDDGKSVIDIMNATGYDVATLGNHEFDYGITAMTANVARCAFPVTSCNLVHRNAADEPGERVLPAYVVVTGGAARVAFVGATTPTTLVASKPATFLSEKGDYREWDFIAGENGEAFYAAVQKAVDEAATKADYVVVLGHLGVSSDCAPYMSTDLIAHTTNFVALIDGHSHSAMEGARVKNAAGREVILAQTGCYLGALGCLTLDDGACVAASTLFPSRVKDPEVEWLETRLIGAVERQLGARLAIVDATVCAFSPGNGARLARSQECAAGDFAADAYWWFARERAGRCDFALVNGGNVRADIPKGEVTMKTLRTVQPFGGGVGLVEVDGATVIEALEFGAQVVGESESGGFLHAAGLRYEIDARVKSGVRVSPSGAWTGGPSGARRVRNVQVYDREKGAYVPLDPARKYIVAGNSFTLIEGGDGFEMFKRARAVNNSLETDYVALAEYTKAFANGSNGVPRITSANAPLANLKGHPIAYEKPEGSGRITILK